MKIPASILLTVLVVLSISNQAEATEAAVSEPAFQVDELAQIISPPRLSDREPGIHIEPANQRNRQA